MHFQNLWRRAASGNAYQNNTQKHVWTAAEMAKNQKQKGVLFTTFETERDERL